MSIKTLAQIYNDLFARRQESDYVNFVYFEATQVRPWIIDAEQFIGYITSLIENHNE
jgi:uncharacterized protein (UPF0332 family)